MGTVAKRAVAALLAGGLLLLGAAACDDGSQRAASDEATTTRNKKLAAITWCGETGDSLECKNLAEKKKRDEQPNRISYVYLLTNTGGILGYYTVKGKVSSNQSQMGPMDQFVDACGSSTTCWETVEAPGDDGSFGPNEDGIFFFTTGGTKVVWNGTYIQSDAPLRVESPALLVETAK